MTDEAAIIDELDVIQLRAFAHHQNRLVQRLMREREQHLVTVEQAFRRRHNEQQDTIRRLGGDLPGTQRAVLEKTVRQMRDQLNQRKKAS